MDTLSYYKTQSPYTDPGSYAELYAPLPKTAPEICSVVQGLLLDYRERYKYPIVNERLLDMHARTAEKMIKAILTWSKDPLAQVREAPNKFLAGSCDFATLFVSMARNAGIPARKRAGFVNGESCECAEYYDEAAGQWKLMDVSGMFPGEFVPAAKVWKDCRSQSADPKQYTSAMDQGVTLVRANLMLEIAYLNKHELTEWDRFSWSLRPVDLFSDRAWATLDKAADLILAGDAGMDDLQKLYESEEGIQVPGKVRCIPPLTPSHNAEVPV